MSDPSLPADETRENVPGHDVTSLVEATCWLMIVAAPVLRVIHGPPVSADQAAMQLGLVAAALVGAVGLRSWHWRARSRPSRSVFRRSK